jgi:hypothetical protein
MIKEMINNKLLVGGGLFTSVYLIAPSTSGAANGYWDINRWVELKNLINEC